MIKLIRIVYYLFQTQFIY